MKFKLQPSWNEAPLFFVNICPVPPASRKECFCPQILEMFYSLILQNLRLICEGNSKIFLLFQVEVWCHQVKQFLGQKLRLEEKKKKKSSVRRHYGGKLGCGLCEGKRRRTWAFWNNSMTALQAMCRMTASSMQPSDWWRAAEPGSIQIHIQQHCALHLAMPGSTAQLQLR